MQTAFSSRASALATTRVMVGGASKRTSLAPRGTRSPHLVVRAAAVDATVRANPSTLTLAAYAATHISSQFAAVATLPNLYASLAYWTLGAAAVSLLTRKFQHDRISGFVGPAWLALAFCGGFGYITDAQAVVFLFGTVLADDLDGKFSVPYWAWIATLVGAIYKGYGAHWLVAAWAGPALMHVVNALADNGTVSLQQVAVVAAAAWGFYRDQATEVAILLGMASVVWNSVISLQGRMKEAEA